MLKHPHLAKTIAGTWNTKFSTELHMTNDSSSFYTSSGTARIPLYEGKMIWHFEVGREAVRYWVSERDAKAKGLTDQGFYRVGIRSITGATNERTLVCSMLPAGVVCGNSLTVVRRVDENGTELINDLECLCLDALLSSFVVDWNLRLKVLTNVNMFYLYQLPIPRLQSSDKLFRPLVERAARLIATTPNFDALLKEVFGPKANHRSHGVTNETKRTKLRAELDAIVAQLYDLTEDEFAHILATFPLVPQEVKTLTLNMFRAVLPSPEDKVIQNLIQAGESDKVEFKEGAAYSTQRNQKSPDMIRNVLREIAAFLNSGGGNVFLGVTDTGKIVGIADDMRHADSKKKNRDGYDLFLRNSIGSKLGTIQSSNCKITFHSIGNLEVCRILVPATTTPVYLEGNLIVRDGTSSRQLNAQEAATYVAHHWPARS